MDFKFNADKSVALKNGGNGVDTGIHKATITKAFVTKTTNGNNILDLMLKTQEGSQFAVYGMCIDEKWSSGAENYDYKKFMELAMVAGMATGEMYDTEHEVTRNGAKTKEACKAFKELEGKVINIAVYWEFGLNKDGNKEVKSRKIQRTFSAEGLALTEIEAGKTEGKAMAKLEDRMGDYETKAWKQWKNGGTADSAMEAPETGSADAGSDEDLI